MSIMFLSSQDYPSGQIIEFNIEAAKESKNIDIKAICDELTFKEAISIGEIHIRKDNGDIWYINPEGTIARLITNDQLELIHNWDKQTLLPTDKQLEKLIEIGGLPSDQYSMYPENLEFPAIVTTNSGQQIDLCIFHFSEAPPFQRYFRNVLLLSDIADIRPSELALSHELRIRSTLAQEIRMAFYPFMVRTKSGELITYNGKTQFASTSAIKGNDIETEVEFSYHNFDKVNDVSYNDITFVIGKWDQRLNELFNQYRQLQESKSATKTLPKALRSFWQRLFGS